MYLSPAPSCMAHGPTVRCIACSCYSRLTDKSAHKVRGLRMDLAAAIKVMIRRWPVLVAGLVMTLGGVAYIYSTAPVTYESRGQVMVLLPSTASSPDYEVSPFLYMPSGLTTLARVVSLIPTTEQYRASMRAAGFDSEYEIGLDDRAPIVTMSVQGSDPHDVLATRDELVARFGRELQRVQMEERVPKRQFAHLRTLEASVTAEAVTGSRMRAAVAAIAAGGLVTLVALFGIDSALSLWSRRRSRAASSIDGDTPRSEDLATMDESGIRMREGTRVARRLEHDSAKARPAEPGLRHKSRPRFLASPSARSPEGEPNATTPADDKH